MTASESRLPLQGQIHVLHRAGQDADGAAALAGWAAATGERVPSVAGLAPFGRARDLEALVWLLGMAHLYPRRYRTPAAERLAETLQRW